MLIILKKGIQQLPLCEITIFDNGINYQVFNDYPYAKVFNVDAIKLRYLFINHM